MTVRILTDVQKHVIEMWHKAWPDAGAFVRASAQDLERFAELVRADERAACAKVCDDAFDKFFSEHEMEFQRERYDKASVVRTVRAAVEFVTEDCAAAIRARTSS